MNHPSWILVWTSLFGVACDSRPHRVLPFAPTTSATVTAPPPAPAPAPPINPNYPPAGLPHPIEVGEVVKRREAAPPECVGFPGWGCVYFRLDAPASGMLTVELRYDRNANRGQSVDVTIASHDFETWAQESDQVSTRARTRVTAGSEYVITLWYTFPDFEFELRTSLVPD